MSDADKIELLKDSLIEWKEKWNVDIDSINRTIKDGDYLDSKENQDLHNVLIQKNAMSYMANWIINSINGGLDKKHSTNICNIILKERY
jgi:hypothetical protein